MNLFAWQRKQLLLLVGIWVSAFATESRLGAEELPLRGFFGDDLAIVGQPFELQLPAGEELDVSWGDGQVERITKDSRRPVQHTFTKAGVIAVSVQQDLAAGKQSLAVDFGSRIRRERPLAYLETIKNLPANPPLSANEPADSITLECRVQIRDLTVKHTLFSSRGQPTGNWEFGIRPGELYFALNGKGVVTAPLNKRLTANTWHHLTLTYDRVPLFPQSNQVRFYVDGCPIGTSTIAANDAGPVRIADIMIGSDQFPGKIEQAAIYNQLVFPLAIWEHAQAITADNKLWVTVADRGAEPVKVTTPAITKTVAVALDPNPQADNGPTLRKAVSAAGNGTRLRLVGPDGGAGGTFYVRSLIEANRWAAILIDGKTDFEFDGNDSTLVFADKAARYIWVDHCQRVAVRNLRVDLDPHYVQVGMYAKLLQVTPETQSFQAQLISGRDGTPLTTLPSRASYWRWRSHDPKTLRIGGNGPHFDSGSYAAKPVANLTAGPAVFRFQLKQKAEDKLWKQLQDYAAGPNFYLINNADFSSHAISATDSSHLTFERINFYASLGMVFLSSGIDHLRVAHCRIGLPPGLTAADRPLAAGADGYHFHLMRGHLLFEDNEVALTDDDPISIKDNIYPHVKKIADNQLAVGKGIHDGSPVELLNPDYSLTGFTATVTAAKDGVLTLDRPLPADVQPESFLMDRSHHTRDWILRNNYLHDYYGRVMLYTDYGTVINNRIHNSFYHLGNSAAYFETAGASRNVITHRNLFEATVADSSNWGGNQQLTSFHRLTYSANSFVGQGLKLNNAADSLIARNRFDGPDAKVQINRCVRTQAVHNRSSQNDLKEFPLTVRESTDITQDENAVGSK